MIENSEVILERKQIKRIVNNCAKTISKKLDSSKKYTVIVLMNGAYKFASDLLSSTSLEKFDFDIHFVKVTRKENNNTFTLEADFKKLKQICANKDVIVLDEIYDTGTTILSINDAIKDVVKSLLFVVLLGKSKPPIDNIIIAHYLDTDKWLFGYGMDYKDNDYRHL
ncbi:MAG: phosphoribosyltransferase family protein, partial [Minisyncoccia bacterium]